MGVESVAPLAVFGFLSIGAVALFSMITIAVWTGERRRERESYYRNEMLKRVAEAQGPGAASALELLREENRLLMLHRRQGLKISGLLTFAVGLGLMIFLRALIHEAPIYLVGLMVLLMGGALYGGSYVVKTTEA